MATAHRPFTTTDIRDIAIVGHAGAGKTTLVEALLHKTGVKLSAGSVA
jgi:elongation factor G